MAGVATDPIMAITAIKPRRSVEVSFIRGGGGRQERESAAHYNENTTGSSV